MLQEFLTRLPAEVGPRGLVVALAVTGVGLLLWLAGARVGRSVFALAGVAVGAWLGLRVPRWFGWEIDAMGVAIGAALVLGLAGYLLHTLWVGLTLGTLLAAVGVGIAWHRLAPQSLAWSVPPIDPTGSPADVLRAMWAARPTGFPGTIPLVAAGCLAVGCVTAALLPRLGRVLAFSMLGSVMLAGGGVASVALTRPEWLARLPAATQTQALGLAALVAVGAVIQWALLPRARKPAATPEVPASSPPAGLRPPRTMRDVPRVPASPPPPPFKLKEAHA